jgi:hypothetical protein
MTRGVPNVSRTAWACGFLTFLTGGGENCAWGTIAAGVASTPWSPLDDATVLGAALGACAMRSPIACGLAGTAVHPALASWVWTAVEAQAPLIPDCQVVRLSPLHDSPHQLAPP